MQNVHRACFDCRHAFKQRGSSYWDPDVPARPYPCPVCGKPMARLGRHFKAPSKREREQWLKVELLHHFGEGFSSSCSGLGTTCRTLAMAVHYLSARRDSREVRAVLDEIRKSRVSAGK